MMGGVLSECPHEPQAETQSNRSQPMNKTMRMALGASLLAVTALQFPGAVLAKSGNSKPPIKSKQVSFSKVGRPTR